MIESFIPTTEYNRAIIAFAGALGLDTDELKIAMGEVFNVWPESVRGDAVRPGKPS